MSPRFLLLDEGGLVRGEVLPGGPPQIFVCQQVERSDGLCHVCRQFVGLVGQGGHRVDELGLDGPTCPLCTASQALVQRAGQTHGDGLAGHYRTYAGCPRGASEPGAMRPPTNPHEGSAAGASSRRTGRSTCINDGIHERTWCSPAAVRAASTPHRRARSKQAVRCNTVLGICAINSLSSDGASITMQ